MKEYVESLSNSGLSRKDMIESHEGVVRTRQGDLDSANKDCQQTILSRASRKEKNEKFNYACRCLVKYFEACDKLTAVKLFYKLEEK